MVSDNGVISAFVLFEGAGKRQPDAWQPESAERVLVTWRELLSDVDDDQLLAAARYLARSPSPWWPTVGEILARVGVERAAQPGPHRPLDRWRGRLRTTAERHGADGAFWSDFVEARHAEDDVGRSFAALFAVCESPIEEAMLHALLVVALCRGLRVYVRLPSGIGGMIGPVSEGEVFDVAIWPQHAVGQYRVDFAISDDGPSPVVVECDGAEFHESAEARLRDASRDAALNGAGYRVLRFPGRAIWADAVECAGKALVLLRRPDEDAP